MNTSERPCPICHQPMIIIGRTEKGKPITSCGHSYRFNKTKSQKMMDRQFISYPWGLERASN